MIIRNFEVYSDDDLLLEKVPAVVNGNGTYTVNTVVELTIQTPNDTPIILKNITTDEEILINPTNRKATYSFLPNSKGVYIFRVGNELLSKLNEARIEVISNTIINRTIQEQLDNIQSALAAIIGGAV